MWRNYNGSMNVEGLDCLSLSTSVVKSLVPRCKVAILVFLEFESIPKVKSEHQHIRQTSVQELDHLCLAGKYVALAVARRQPLGSTCTICQTLKVLHCHDLDYVLRSFVKMLQHCTPLDLIRGYENEHQVNASVDALSLPYPPNKCKPRDVARWPHARPSNLIFALMFQI